MGREGTRDTTPSACYGPRAAEQTLLHATVRIDLETFVAQMEQRYPLPSPRILRPWSPA